MRRGYIRLSRAGPDLDAQQAALRSAGVDDFSEYGPVYVDEIPSGRRATDLPQRASVLRSLEPGDELVVSSASRLGTSLADVLAVVKEIGRREASVFDVEMGETVRWHPDAVHVVAFAQRAESGNRKDVAAKMQRKRVDSGRLGGAPNKGWKISEKAARELWSDLTRSAADVAAEVGASVPTLYRRLGERGAPRGGSRQTDSNSKLKRKSGKR